MFRCFVTTIILVAILDVFDFSPNRSKDENVLISVVLINRLTTKFEIYAGLIVKPIVAAI